MVWQIALAAGAALLNYAQGRSQAKAQNRFNKKQYELNRKEALRDMVLQLQSVGQRVNEERTSTWQALLQLRRDADQALGDAAVSAAAGGVEGSSIKSLLDDYTRQELIRSEVLRYNLSIRENEAALGIKEIEAQTVNRIVQGIPQPIQGPSFLNAVIQIGAQAALDYENLYGD